MNCPSDESLANTKDRQNECDRFRISNNNDNPLHKNSMQYNQMKVGSKRNFSDL
jgi:hypothetical protein